MTQRQATMIGRTHDVERLRGVLRHGSRLITLRGPGGIGKTTLATHLADSVRAEYDLVLFVDLSALRDPQQVLASIAAHLPTAVPHSDPLRRLVDFCDGRRVALFLDNFEQVLSAADHLAELLARTTKLQIVVTSRAVLNLHDEQEYQVDPLGLPIPQEGVTSSPAVPRERDARPP